MSSTAILAIPKDQLFAVIMLDEEMDGAQYIAIIKVIKECHTGVGQEMEIKAAIAIMNALHSHIVVPNVPHSICLESIDQISKLNIQYLKYMKNPSCWTFSLFLFFKNSFLMQNASFSIL